MTCVGCCVEEVWRMQEGLEGQLCRDWSDGPCSDSYSPACWYSGSVLSSLLTVRESCVQARPVCVEFAASPVFVQLFSQSPGFSCYQKYPQLTLLVLARHTPEKELYFLVTGTFTHTHKKNPSLKESDRCLCMLLPLAPSAWSCQNMRDTKVKGRRGQQSQHHCGSHCAQNWTSAILTNCFSFFIWALLISRTEDFN